MGRVHGTLNYNYRIETHIIKSKNIKTFKMHGFERQNMFTIMNSMMNDPEIQKFAKNFEEQMKNSRNPKITKLQIHVQLKNRAPPPLLPKLLKTLALHQKQKIHQPAQCFQFECAIQEKTTEIRHQTLFQFH